MKVRWLSLIMAIGLLVAASPAQASDRQQNGKQAPSVRQQGPAALQRTPAAQSRREPGRVHQNDQRHHRDHGGRFVHPNGNRHGRQETRHHYRYNDGHVHYYAYGGQCYHCGFAYYPNFRATYGQPRYAYWIAIAAPATPALRQIRCSICKQWWQWAPAYEGQPTPGLPPCWNDPDHKYVTEEEAAS